MQTNAYQHFLLIRGPDFPVELLFFEFFDDFFCENFALI